jgi:hypothetical protein
MWVAADIIYDVLIREIKPETTTMQNMDLILLILLSFCVLGLWELIQRGKSSFFPHERHQVPS